MIQSLTIVPYVIRVSYSGLLLKRLVQYIPFQRVWDAVDFSPEAHVCALSLGNVNDFVLVISLEAMSVVQPTPRFQNQNQNQNGIYCHVGLHLQVFSGVKVHTVNIKHKNIETQ